MGQPYINGPVARTSVFPNSQPPQTKQETASFKGGQATGGDGGQIPANGQGSYNFLTDSSTGLSYDVTFTAVASTNSIPAHILTAATESKISLKGINDIGIPEEVQIILKKDPEPHGSAVLLRRNPPATEFQSSTIQPGDDIRLPDRGSLKMTPDGQLILTTANGVTIQQSANNGVLESSISATADRLGQLQGFLGQTLDTDKSAGNDFKQGLEAFKTGGSSGPTRGTPVPSPIPTPTPKGPVAANETASLLKTGFGTYSAEGGDGGQQQVSIQSGIYNLLSDQNLTLNARFDKNYIPPESEAPRAPDSGIKETALTLGLRTVTFNSDGTAIIGNADPRLGLPSLPITFSTTPTPIPGGNGATVMLGRENTLIIRTAEYEIVQKAELNGFISVTVHTLEKGVQSDGVPSGGFLGQSFEIDNKANNDFKVPLEKFKQDSLVPIPTPPVVTDDALVATDDALTVVRIADKDGDGGVNQKELQAFIEGPQLASLKYAQLSKAAGILLNGFDALKRPDGNLASISAEDIKIAAASDGNIENLTLSDIEAVKNQPVPSPVPVKTSFSSQELKDILALADVSTLPDPIQSSQHQPAPRRGDGKLTVSELDNFIQRSNTQIQQLQKEIKQLERDDHHSGAGKLAGSLRITNTKLLILKAQLDKLQRQVEGAQLLKDNFGLFSTNIRGIGNPPAGGLPQAVIFSGDIDRVAANTAPTATVTVEDLDAERAKLPKPGDIV